MLGFMVGCGSQVRDKHRLRWPIVGNGLGSVGNQLGLGIRTGEELTVSEGEDRARGESGARTSGQGWVEVEGYGLKGVDADKGQPCVGADGREVHER